jgi:hypothetical protein
MSLEDVEYYRLRALEERRLADQATSAEAAAAHAELAGHYAALVAHADMLPKRHGPTAVEDRAA